MNKPGFTIHSYPWYISDWRDSETRVDMTMEERGMYREAIDYNYREGSLPDDRRKLIAILGCTEQEFERSWPAVRKQFIERDGRLENPRVREVLPQLEKWHEQRRKAGKVSGLNRRNRKNNSLNSRSTDVATDVQREHEPSSTTSTSTSTSTSTATAGAATEPKQEQQQVASPKKKTWNVLEIQDATDFIAGREPTWDSPDSGTVLRIVENMDSLDDLRLFVKHTKALLEAKNWGMYVSESRMWPAVRGIAREKQKLNCKHGIPFGLCMNCEDDPKYKPKGPHYETLEERQARQDADDLDAAVRRIL